MVKAAMILLNQFISSTKMRQSGENKFRITWRCNQMKSHDFILSASSFGRPRSREVNLAIQTMVNFTQDNKNSFDEKPNNKIKKKELCISNALLPSLKLSIWNCRLVCKFVSFLLINSFLVYISRIFRIQSTLIFFAIRSLVARFVAVAIGSSRTASVCRTIAIVVCSSRSKHTSSLAASCSHLFSKSFKRSRKSRWHRRTNDTHGRWQKFLMRNFPHCILHFHQENIDILAVEGLLTFMGD